MPRPRKQPRPLPDHCLSGEGCSSKPLPEKRFCGPHQGQLDDVREALKRHDFVRSVDAEDLAVAIS